MYDVTLAYPPDNNVTLAGFVMGRVPKIIVHARRVALPESVDRDEVKLWVDEIWKEKDALLTQLLSPPLRASA